MQDKNINLKSFIPHVGHTNLLYIASVVWFFAGGMLLYRGFMGVMIHSEFLLPKVVVALFLGLVFYNLMFKKISKKHITRIEGLKNKKHPFYAFFNLRSYLMMIFMISMGITIRLLLWFLLNTWHCFILLWVRRCCFRLFGFFAVVLLFSKIHNFFNAHLSFFVDIF